MCVLAVKSKQLCSMPGEYLANLSIVIHFQLGFKFDIGIYGPGTRDTTTELRFLVLSHFLHKTLFKFIDLNTKVFDMILF